MKYRSTQIVEAVQWRYDKDSNNTREVTDFLGNYCGGILDFGREILILKEPGVQYVSGVDRITNDYALANGCYAVKYSDGRYQAVSPESFEASFAPV